MSSKFTIKLVIVVMLTALIAGAMIATGPDEEWSAGLRTSEGVR